MERLDVKLGQEVLYYHYHNKTVNADTLDELREIREEIMEEEFSYFTAISQRVWTDYDKKEKELSGEAEVSEEKESLEEINGIAEPIQATNSVSQMMNLDREHRRRNSEPISWLSSC